MKHFKKGDVFLLSAINSDNQISSESLVKLTSDSSGGYDDGITLNDYIISGMAHYDDRVFILLNMVNAHFYINKKDFLISQDINTIMNFKKKYLDTIFTCKNRMK